MFNGMFVGIADEAEEGWRDESCISSTLKKEFVSHPQILNGWSQIDSVPDFQVIQTSSESCSGRHRQPHAGHQHFLHRVCCAESAGHVQKHTWVDYSSCLSPLNTLILPLNVFYRLRHQVSFWWQTRATDTVMIGAVPVSANISSALKRYLLSQIDLIINGLSIHYTNLGMKLDDVAVRTGNVILLIGNIFVGFINGFNASKCVYF